MTSTDSDRVDVLDSILAQFRKNYDGPYLIYDTSEIMRSGDSLARVGRLSGVRFICAIKALPTNALLSAGSRIGGGFDVSNVGELGRLVTWCKQSNRNRELDYVSLTGPAFELGRSEVEPIVKLMTVNIERISQLNDLHQLRRWTAEIELGARVAVKMNCNDRSSSARPVGFGFSDADTESFSLLARHDLFGALHCHLGAGAVAKGAPLHAARRLLAIANETGMKLKRLNLGGGFRTETLDEVQTICEQVRSIVPREVEVIFEPGAWLTERAGYAFCRILSRTLRREFDTTLVTVDLSRASHVRWSKPRILHWWGKKPSGSKVLLFGPTCYEEDYLCAADCQDLPCTDGEENIEWVLLAGITGYDAAFNVSFNGVERAKIFMV